MWGPIPMATWSKVWICGRLLAGIWILPWAWMSVTCECVCCQVSALALSLVQRSPIKCVCVCVTECDCEALIMRKTCLTRGCCTTKQTKKNHLQDRFTEFICAPTKNFFLMLCYCRPVLCCCVSHRVSIMCRSNMHVSCNL